MQLFTSREVKVHYRLAPDRVPPPPPLLAALGTFTCCFICCFWANYAHTRKNSITSCNMITLVKWNVSYHSIPCNVNFPATIFSLCLKIWVQGSGCSNLQLISGRIEYDPLDIKLISLSFLIICMIHLPPEHPTTTGPRQPRLLYWGL